MGCVRDLHLCYTLPCQGLPLLIVRTLPVLGRSDLSWPFPSSTCHNGQLNCSFTRCPLDGGFTPWSPWTPCSVSCGGLGHMTRARGCTSPPPANGGKDCVGPRTDIKYCQTPDCPGEWALGALQTRSPLCPRIPRGGGRDGQGWPCPASPPCHWQLAHSTSSLGVSTGPADPSLLLALDGPAPAGTGLPSWRLWPVNVGHCPEGSRRGRVRAPTWRASSSEAGEALSALLPCRGAQQACP